MGDKMIELTTNGYYLFGAVTIATAWGATIVGVRALPYSIMEKEPVEEWRPAFAFGMKMAPFFAFLATLAIWYLSYRQEGGIIAMVLGGLILNMVHDRLTVKRVLALIDEGKIEGFDQLNLKKGDA